MKFWLGRFWKSAAGWSIFSQIFRIGGLLLLLPLMLRTLTPNELGVWYLYQSLGFLFSLGDFGLSLTSTRAVSYLWAGATEVKAFGFGDVPNPEAGPNRELLGALVFTMVRFYMVVGLIIGVAVLCAGGGYIAIVSPDAMRTEALTGWGVYALAGTLGFYGGIYTIFLTGINEVRISEQIFLAGLITNYVFTAIGLLCGLSLLAPTLGYFLMGLVTRSAGIYFFKKRAGMSVRPGAKLPFRWDILKTLWPNSWRQAVVSISSSGMQNTPLLLCAHFSGVAAAASLGLTTNIARLCLMVSWSVLKVKLPLINMLHARRDFQSLQHIFRRRFLLTMGIFFFLAFTAMFLTNQTLSLVGSKTPVLSLSGFFLVFSLQGIDLFRGSMLNLVSTANVVPLWRAWAATAAISMVFAYFGGAVWGIGGILAACLASSLIYLDWNALKLALKILNPSFQRHQTT